MENTINSENEKSNISDHEKEDPSFSEGEPSDAADDDFEPDDFEEEEDLLNDSDDEDWGPAKSKKRKIVKPKKVSSKQKADTWASIEAALGSDFRRKSSRNRKTPNRFEEFEGEEKISPDSEMSDATPSDLESDSDYGEHKKKKRKILRQTFAPPILSDTSFEPRRSSRNVKKKSYAEDEEEEDELDEDEMEGKETYEPEQEEEEGEVIERILDHRETESEDIEYLVKWKGKAHIHNKWDTFSNLENFKGIKKLQNYIKQVEAEEEWRKSASPEEIENANVALETHRETYMEYLKVDRVIAIREVETENGTPIQQYMVKWKELPYGECTWENMTDIEEFQHEIDEFLARNQNIMQESVHSIPPNKRPHFSPMSEQPSSDWLIGGNLRDYQLHGLNWLVHNWCKNINCILADEMGLGKTIQTISFLGYLYFEAKISGPSLIVVPLSTIGNWENEFQKWAPGMNVIVYTGNSASREMIRNYEFYRESRKGSLYTKFGALLTTYEIVLKDKHLLSAIRWNYLIVDEAHRLKNNESMLYEVLVDFRTCNRLLITGTPLQNSMKELWSLLHFLHPNKFSSLETFQGEYAELKEEGQIAKLHEELKPYLLRRIKKDVEKSLPAKTERILRVDMTNMQKKYYRWILAKNFSALNKGVKGPQTTLLNIVMELKKACNHPYLFENAEDRNADNPLKELIKNSGKMILLDKLLVKLQETGHRVLIFSQMVRMLDILSDYLHMKGFSHQRLDGSMGKDSRQKAMNSFNAEGSRDFCFLLSTRAGGLGINLSTADTVIIFDSDWNPQNDLQAQARAHRIGQKNHVNIYRFVMKDTVEENILQRAKDKMVLDHLVIQTMGEKSKASNQVFNKEELAAILKFGAKDIFQDDEPKNAERAEDMDIDDILARAETSNYEHVTAGEELLNAFKVASFSTTTEESEEKNEESWENIIPQEARVETQQEEKLQEYLPPRRTRAIRFRFEPPEEDAPKKKKTRESRGKSKRQSSSKDELSTKDIKHALHSLYKFGDLSRMSEIIDDVSMDRKPHKLLEKAIEDIVSLAQDSENDYNEKKKATFDYEGVKINATELLERMEDLSQLSKRVAAYKDNPKGFRINVSIKAVRNWGCSWGPKDDSMLLYGIHKHGFGNWEAIRGDKILGVDKTKGNGEPLPKSVDLKRRAEMLFKALRSTKPKKMKVMKNSRAAVNNNKGKKRSAVVESIPVPKRMSRRRQKRSLDEEIEEGEIDENEEQVEDTQEPEEEEEEEPEEVEEEDFEEKYDKGCLKECKKLMKDVQTILDKFKAMSSNSSSMTKKEKIRLTKEYISKIGERIEEVLGQTKSRRYRERLERHLWHYSSTFTAQDGPSLQRLYDKITKKQSF